jgi:Glyoxalase-like domain
MHRSRIGLALVDHPSSSYDEATRFWAAVTGSDTQPSAETYASVALLQDLHLETQRLGAGQPRIHLDIEADDVAAEIARVIELGATLVERHDEYAILTDPGGLLFCVVPVQTGSEFDAHARTWP